MKINFFGFLVLVLAACQSNTNSRATDTNKSGVFYHYSLWEAFVNKIYDGNLTVAELKQKGDIGLGSYNGLHGELVMLDNQLYEANGDGSVSMPNDSAKICYANATFFNKDLGLAVSSVNNYDSLRVVLNKALPSKNYFYAFKIHATFNNLKLGGVPKQQKPYTQGLDVLIPQRPTFDKENITGTMVGFYCPDYIGKINVAGYHLHFVSDDKKSAGHVMEFNKASNLDIEINKIAKYQFEVPENQDFDTLNMSKSFQYNKK